MTLLAQHGYGKSDKLEVGLRDDVIGGAVFSTKDEKPESLARCVRSLRAIHPDATIIIDPQFQLSMYRPAKSRYLTEYEYFTPNLRPADFARPTTVQKYVKQVIDVQRELEVTSFLSPTVHVDSFSEREYQVALSLAAESLEYHAGLNDEDRPLQLSFVLNEHAFAKQGGVDEFLDHLTAWEAEGVYLVVARAESGYSTRFDPNRLANVMYAVYVLGALNDMEVTCGYTDLHGVLLRAAGATSFAGGWSQGCRYYHRSRFLERKGGGRPPRLRYCSSPLLNSIFLTELEQIHDVGELDSVLSETPSDSVITAAASPVSSDWSQQLSMTQHWEALSQLDADIQGDVLGDVTWVEESIAEARVLYSGLGEACVACDRVSWGDHLEEWADALKMVRGKAAI